MIRRWSCINNINHVKSVNFNTLSFVHYESTTLTNIFLKKNIDKISVFTRKNWVRRKHWTNLLIYNNILLNWFGDYLFFKRYNKFVFNLKIFKTSFFSYNLMFLKNTLPVLNKNTEKVLISSVTRNIMKYFSLYSSNNYSSLLKFKNIIWITVSSPTINFNFKKNIPVVQTLYNLNNNVLYPAITINDKIYWWNQIYNLWIMLILIKIKELYKVTQLLCLTNLLLS